jgi:chromosome segregation ATPase
MNVPISATAAFMLLMSMPLSAQVSEPRPAQETKQAPGARVETPTAGQNSDLEGDLFTQLRENASLLRSTYEDLDVRNVKEVDRLLLTKKCQSNRIGPLLDRAVSAMEQWLDAERHYYRAWNEKESRRVEEQQKTLASMEEQQKRVADLIEEEKKNEERSERDKAGLEKSKRTEEINAEIDRLIKDIQDSEATLANAQREYSDLTVSISNMKHLLSVKLTSIRQNLQRLDVFEVDQRATYDGKREAAHRVCNIKNPDLRSPLPKRVSQ